MQAAATLQPLKRRNRRAAPRRTLHLDIRLGATGEKVRVHDLSPTGLLIETGAALHEFDQLAVELPEIGTTMATVVWSSGNYFGCQFHDVLPKRAVSAALLRSSFEPALRQAPVALPAAQNPGDEDEEPDDAGADDRLPLGIRLRVILGTSLALWALILWAAGVI